MRIKLEEVMTTLGVGHMLSPYETCPWSTYDGEKGLTASAEVRMDNTGLELEVELQFMYDQPEAGKPPVEQVVWMFWKPIVAGQWAPTQFRLRGGDETAAIYNWEEKGANFFRACVQEIKMDKIPDIDELIERELGGKERFRDGRQGGGSKAPKIKPQQLLGMKNGRGF